MSEVRFSGFQIVEEVGGGPTGVVFRCRGAAGGEVAVKRLNALGIDRERIGRNCRRFLNAPSHEGVVPIMEFQIDSAPYFIASDWVESGRRFSDLPGAVNERDAWPQVIRLAEALAHLHRHGVHHGNLHPGNVFVEMGDGIRCRVADFGPGLAGKVHHLNLGETAWFAPPEQLESSLHWDDGAIERWDVYRFGALAFWLINGVTPRGAEYRAARERQIEISGGRPVEVDMAALAADMASAEACGWMVEPADRECELRRRIIVQCLKLNPEERPVDMREVCDAFAALERQFEAERTEARIQKTLDDADTRIRQTIEEAEARVLRERQLQASNLRRTRWLAAGLASRKRRGGYAS